MSRTLLGGLSPKLHGDLDLILDTFSGGDGCASYIKLVVTLTSLERSDNPRARDITNIVSDFARLIRIANEAPMIKLDQKG